MEGCNLQFLRSTGLSPTWFLTLLYEPLPVRKCRTKMRHRHEIGTTDRIGASTGRTHSFTAISYLDRGCNWHSQLHRDRAIFNAFWFNTLLGLTTFFIILGAVVLYHVLASLGLTRLRGWPLVCISRSGSRMPLVPPPCIEGNRGDVSARDC